MKNLFQSFKRDPLGWRMSYSEASKLLSQKDKLRAHLDTHGLLHISGFPLDLKKLTKLASKFGTAEPVPKEHSHPDFPSVRVQSNIPGVGVAGGGHYWHSDGPWRPSPTSTTLLLCEIAPSVGGETLFVDMRKAYDQLSENDKAGLAKLMGDYPCRSRYQARLEKEGKEDTLEIMDTLEDLQHPLVRRHPRTDEPSLYLNQEWLRGIVGFTHEQSQNLLSALLIHAAKPENVYAHNWKVGDLLIWDNDSMMHKANSADVEHPKKTLRITIASE